LAWDLRERGVDVEVELEVDGDRAQALRAGTLDVIDAVGARDDALEWRGDEPAHEVGIRADIGVVILTTAMSLRGY